MIKDNIFMLIVLTMISLSCSSQQNTQRNHAKSKETKISMENKKHHVNPYYSHVDTVSLKHVSLDKWKKVLSPKMYNIAFKKGTDKRFSGYWKFKGKGAYYCAVCGNKLFFSTAKFASSCGWPTFFKPIIGSVIYKHDDRYNMNRIEVLCSRCDAHLGHIFNDGPKPTGLRYCMNSTVLDFVADVTLRPNNDSTDLDYFKIIKKTK